MHDVTNTGTESSTSRFWVHMVGIVSLALVLGHLQVPDWVKIATVAPLCALIIIADAYRVWLYYTYDYVPAGASAPRVQHQERRRFIQNANDYLIGKKLIREWARGWPSTATPLAFVIMVALLIQVPIWVMVPSLITFAAGDAFAREIGVRTNGQHWKIWKRREKPKKTWTGLFGYIWMGTLFGAFTLVLDQWFPLYPDGYATKHLFLFILLTAVLGGVVEACCELISERLSKIFDDNLIVPIISLGAFYAFATAGTI